MFKFLVPLVFLLLADGKAAAPEIAGAKAAPPVATEAADRKRAPDKKSAAEAARRDRAGADREVSGDAAEPAASAAPKRLAAKAPAPEGERLIKPPSGISAPAMRDEMGQRSESQKAASERERLEALSTDLARTRAALREETARLESMVEKAKQAGASKPAGAATPAPVAAAPATNPATPPRAPGETPREPQTMPLGDPLAPNAYFRPTPPPPNFAVQVEVVSKAMKSMKPEQAAGIIGHLERGLAAEVLQRMRPADAGAILGFLKPEVGAALAAEIVSRPPVGAKPKADPDKEKP